MKRIKRVISLLLIVLMLVNLIPADVYATPDTESETTTNSGMTVEGTNGFGNLLSKELTEHQAGAGSGNDGYTGEYVVTDLVVEGNTATITYSAKEEALLIVALYTEDGRQLMNNAQTVVQPEETIAEITFDGEVPEYFRASAYLVDPYDFSPFCESYETSIYTRAMQELLNSTIDDYDEERVWNLDDDKTTNFMVYEETTIVIPMVDGVNEVVEADDENTTYVIENADEHITKLQKGDVFVYHFGENDVLIVKVDRINKDGNRVTVTGDDLEIEEVFSQVKLEVAGDTSDLIVDESTCGEGVTYGGLVDENSQTYSLKNAMSRAAGGSVGVKYHSFPFEYEEKTEEESIKIKGGIELSLNLKLKFYINSGEKRIEFKADANMAVELGVDMKFAYPIDAIQLPSMGFQPFVGVFIGFEPRVELQVTAKIQWEFSVDFTIGFAYESANDNNFQNLCTPPKMQNKLKYEGTLFFGVDFHPHISIAADCIAKISLKSLVGIKLEGKFSGTEYEEVLGRPDKKHICGKCLKGKVSGILQFGVELNFLKADKWTFKFNVPEINIELCEFYFSYDYFDFGFGSCPYEAYRLTIIVNDDEGNPQSGVPVSVVEGIDCGSTNKKGVTTCYLPKGSYVLKAELADTLLEKKIEVETACKISMNPLHGGGGLSFDDVNFEDIIQIDGEQIGSGECGSESSNVTWKMYDNGLLVINGSGAMKDDPRGAYPYNQYRNEIVKVVISPGITHVSDSAFLDFSALIDVELPDSLESIGQGAFYNCSNLESIELPPNLRDIGEAAFYLCESLQTIELPPTLRSIGVGAFNTCTGISGDVIIPKGITKIENSVFYGCQSINSIVLSDALVHIEEWAFAGCENLENINLPEGLKTIGKYAFYRCRNLKSIKLPTTLNTLESYAFNDCSSLSGRVEIPEGIKNLEGSTFGMCKSLEEMILPKSLKSIGSNAISQCDSLKTIEIPDTVETIGESAFFHCDNLTSVKLPKSLTVLSDSVFMYCVSLKEIEIPDTVTSIGSDVFAYCESLTSIEIPASVKSLGINVLAAHGWDDRPSKIVWFRGSAPEIDMRVFEEVEVTIYYPANDSSWTAEVMEEYKNKCLSVDFIWIPYTPKNVAEVRVDELIPAKASFGGEYGNETVDGLDVKTASFKDLVPGGQYLLLAVLKTNVKNLVSEENLLYIKQGMASEDGTLHFQYIPKRPTDIAYVVVCGPSNKNLVDAQITFQEMYADEEIQAINPIVVYEGKTLVEEKDYILTGEVCYVEAGTYTCYVIGIGNYTGVVECKYTVNDSSISKVQKVERIYGKTRYETSFKIADVYRENLGVSKFGTVIIACGTNFADALAGGYLASIYDAPILMYNNKVGKSNVVEIVDYVNKNLISNGTVYLLGGTGAVGEDVEKALAQYHVKRLGGTNRYETNLEILKEAGGKGKDILVCTGQNFADSLSGSAVQMPILLVNNKKGTLTDKQKNFLEEFDGKTIYVIGGTEAISETLKMELEAYGNVERIGGTNRYETSVLLAEKFFNEPKAAVLTVGKNFPDGLCGGMLASSMNAPLILTISNKNSVMADAYAEKWGIENGTVLGGPGLIADETVRVIFNMEADASIIEK